MGELHAHCQCDNCSGADCGQDDPETHEIYQAGIKLHDDAVRQDERDKIYKRLKNMTETESKSILSKLVTTTYVNWSDIDCLFAELKDDPEKEAAPVGDA
jgi:hypothetical protein